MFVEFLTRFNKDLDNIEDRETKQRVIEIIEKIESSERLSELSNIKKLIGYKTAYRIKLGDYRIGFFFENGIVELARIIHRKDIYKLFP